MSDQRLTMAAEALDALTAPADDPFAPSPDPFHNSWLGDTVELHVRVTADDFAHARPFDANLCPLALGIDRHVMDTHCPFADADDIAVGVDRIAIISPTTGRWVGEVPASLAFVLRKWQTQDIDVAHAMGYCEQPWSITFTCVEAP